MELTTDVVVVGSGPGGATVAREIVKQGQQVVILERGLDYRSRFYYGTYWGALRYTDRMSFLFTDEGLNVVRPLMVGGATSMFCGSAARPPNWLEEKYGIKIDQEVRETVKELEIAPLADELRGEASTRIAAAAQSLGYDWYPQPKFMRPARGQRFRCRARCMLGCRCGAKWNAAEYVDEAVECGARLVTSAHVNRVIISNHRAEGVEGMVRGESLSVRAGTVVLAAGGIGTPRILQHSGLGEAGHGMAMDTTVMVYGISKERGIGLEPPMTWSWENKDDRYMLSTLVDPWLVFPIIVARKEFKRCLQWPWWGRILGVMIKLKDDLSGGVFPEGRISKPLTESDRERLEGAEAICRSILVQAGASPETIFTTPMRGTHPSGTVRVGELLNTDLSTEIEGLYVCDASTFPQALGRPTVLTIIGLAKRLARHLTVA